MGAGRSWKLQLRGPTGVNVVLMEGRTQTNCLGCENLINRRKAYRKYADYFYYLFF